MSVPLELGSLCVLLVVVVVVRESSPADVSGCQPLSATPE